MDSFYTCVNLGASPAPRPRLPDPWPSPLTFSGFGREVVFARHVLTGGTKTHTAKELSWILELRKHINANETYMMFEAWSKEDVFSENWIEKNTLKDRKQEDTCSLSDIDSKQQPKPTINTSKSTLFKILWPMNDQTLCVYQVTGSSSSTHTV